MTELLQIKVNREVKTSGPPKIVHKFNWVRVGPDVMLEVGYFDLLDLRTAVEAGKSGDAEAAATLHVTDQFALSPQAVIDLIDVVGQLGKDIEAMKKEVEAAK
jgi:hypothetical protein